MVHYSYGVPPRRSPQRLLEIVDAATEVFAQSGFAAAQMVDVARMAGVSVGTLYNYVEGKGALLLLCAERPFMDITVGRQLPVPTPDRVELVARLDETLIRNVRVPTLERALRSPLPRDGLDAQIAQIVGELFDLISATRVAADAMERSAREAPDLGDLFYRRVRVRLLDQLVTYCRRLSKLEPLPPPVSPDLAARFVLETVTWWARHRHRDPAPPDIADATARQVATALVVTTLTGPKTGP
jgi:AcrR family transcriptional regulator